MLIWNRLICVVCNLKIRSRQDAKTHASDIPAKKRNCEQPWPHLVQSSTLWQYPDSLSYLVGRDSRMMVGQHKLNLMWIWINFVPSIMMRPQSHDPWAAGLHFGPVWPATLYRVVLGMVSITRGRGVEGRFLRGQVCGFITSRFWEVGGWWVSGGSLGQVLRGEWRGSFRAGKQCQQW